MLSQWGGEAGRSAHPLNPPLFIFATVFKIPSLQGTSYILGKRL